MNYESDGLTTQEAVSVLPYGESPVITTEGSKTMSAALSRAITEAHRISVSRDDRQPFDPEHIDRVTVNRVRETFKAEFPRMVKTFFRDADRYIGAIVQGFRQHDPQKVLKNAHPLKSASESIGAIKLFFYASKMERAAREIDHNRVGWEAERTHLPHLLKAQEAAHLNFARIIDQGNAAEQGGHSVSASGKSDKNRFILVVDDDETTRLIIQAMLETIGYQVDFATDGGAAVERALRKTYDTILMDIDMPQIDGYEATRQIRENGRCNAAIIAISTTFDRIEQVKRCLESGMNDCLVKPLHRETLAKRLQHWCGVTAETSRF